MIFILPFFLAVDKRIKAPPKAETCRNKFFRWFLKKILFFLRLLVQPCLFHRLVINLCPPRSPSCTSQSESAHWLWRQNDEHCSRASFTRTEEELQSGAICSPERLSWRCSCHGCQTEWCKSRMSLLGVLQQSSRDLVVTAWTRDGLGVFRSLWIAVWTKYLG